MKTQVDKSILYDDECPMCSWYTQKFVQIGVLQAAGRVPLTNAGAACICKIDPDRARHEIALVDHETGETKYGLDSMFSLLSSAFPGISFILKNSLTKKLFYPLYQLITYNRRIMAGGDSRSGAAAPDFNLFWRSLWVVLSIGLGMALLFATGSQFTGVSGGNYFLALVGGGWMISLISGVLSLKRPADYIGHLATVFFAGSLLFIPVLILSALTGLPMPVITLISWIAALLMQYKMLESRRKVLNLSRGWVVLWLTGLVLNGWAVYHSFIH